MGYSSTGAQQFGEHNHLRTIIICAFTFLAVFAPADTALFTAGTRTAGHGENTPREPWMSRWMGGMFAGCETRVGVKTPAEFWPFSGLDTLDLGNSIAKGTEAIVNAIDNTPGKKIIVGLSQGSVIDELAKGIMSARLDGQKPAPADVEFVNVANPYRPGHGLLNFLRGIYVPLANYTPQAIPETEYNCVEIFKEYDGYADWPNRPDWVAMVNAIAGIHYLHADYSDLDPKKIPAENITVTSNARGATTTTYRWPTPTLPIVRLLLAWGVQQEVVDAYAPALKARIDAAYSRNNSAEPAVKTAQAPAR